MRKIDYHLVDVLVVVLIQLALLELTKEVVFSSVCDYYYNRLFHYLRVILLLLVMVMPYIGRKKRERELDHLIVDSASVFGGLWASTQTWRRTITSVHSPYFYCFCLSSLTFLIKNGFDVYLIINLAYVLAKNCNFFLYREQRSCLSFERLCDKNGNCCVFSVDESQWVNCELWSEKIENRNRSTK